MNFEINPSTVHLPIFGGIDVDNTLIAMWIVMAVLTLAALAVRIFVLPRFKERPKGFQNVLELVVETATKFTNDKVGARDGRILAPYFFTLAVLLFSCGLSELIGLRNPLTDMNLTVALAVISFLLINIFGIWRKGVWGRIKSLAKPNPILLPIKVITDLAVPVSLACRLFGSMLGGYIIMEMITEFVPVLAPAVLSLYFTFFHVGIQTFLFITLSLTFIEEATE